MRWWDRIRQQSLLVGRLYLERKPWRSLYRAGILDRVVRIELGKIGYQGLIVPGVGDRVGSELGDTTQTL